MSNWRNWEDFSPLYPPHSPDGTVLATIRQWLDAPVVERADGGGEIRTTVARDTNRGTPQGGVISPMLANLYFRRFMLAWYGGGQQYSLEQGAQARLAAIANSARRNLDAPESGLCAPELSKSGLSAHFGDRQAVQQQLHDGITADALGISRRSRWERMKRLAIGRPPAASRQPPAASYEQLATSIGRGRKSGARDACDHGRRTGCHEDVTTARNHP